MVRFVLYNTSQHFVSREGITFACGFVLISDWLLLIVDRNCTEVLPGPFPIFRWSLGTRLIYVGVAQAHTNQVETISRYIV